MEIISKLAARMGLGQKVSDAQSPPKTRKRKQIHHRLRWPKGSVQAALLFLVLCQCVRETGGSDGRDQEHVQGVPGAWQPSNGHEPPHGQEAHGNGSQDANSNRTATVERKKKGSEESRESPTSDCHSQWGLCRVEEGHQTDAQRRGSSTLQQDQRATRSTCQCRERACRRRSTGERRDLRCGVHCIRWTSTIEQNRTRSNQRDDDADQCEMRCIGAGQSRDGRNASCCIQSDADPHIFYSNHDAPYDYVSRAKCSAHFVTEHAAFQSVLAQCEIRPIPSFRIPRERIPGSLGPDEDTRSNHSRSETGWTGMNIVENRQGAGAECTRTSPSLCAIFQGSNGGQEHWEFLPENDDFRITFALDGTDVPFDGDYIHSRSFFTKESIYLLEKLMLVFFVPCLAILAFFGIGIMTMCFSNSPDPRSCRIICKRRYYTRPKLGRNRTSRPSRWLIYYLVLFPNEILAQPGEPQQAAQAEPLNLDVFTQRGDKAQEEHVYKEIMIHQLGENERLLRADFNLHYTKWRSWIGKALGYYRKGKSFDDHLLYQVHPSPMDFHMIMATHFILENPGDRQLSESLALIDIRRITEEPQKTRGVWNLQSSITRTELLYELDLLRECQLYKTAECFVYIYGELWRPGNEDLRAITNGAYIRILIYDTKLTSESECSDSRSDSRSSRTRHDRSRSPMTRPKATSEEQYDSSSYMQVSVLSERQERLANDEVFRILEPHRNRLNLHESRSFGIILWNPNEENGMSRFGHRVWLEPQQPSWTWRCVETLLPGLCQGQPHQLKFMTATPLPDMWHLSRHNLNLMTITYEQTTASILLDWWIYTPPQRIAIRLQPGETVQSLAYRIAPSFRHRNFCLTWETPDGAIKFHDAEEVRLPQAAHVHLTVEDPRIDCDEPTFSMLQQGLHLISAKNWPSKRQVLTTIITTNLEGNAPLLACENGKCLAWPTPLSFTFYQQKPGILSHYGRIGLSEFCILPLMDFDLLAIPK